MFRCYVIMILQESVAFFAVYCHYWIILLFRIAKNSTNTLTVGYCAFDILLSNFHKLFSCLSFIRNRQKSKLLGKTISQKLELMRKKPMSFSESTPKVNPITGQIFEVSNCVLTSVILIESKRALFFMRLHTYIRLNI